MTPIYIQRQLKPLHFTFAFAAANLVWRIIWLGASRGAYTDGILQIDLFRQGLTYWPPLYALVSLLFARVPGLGLEGSARLISLAAGTLTIFPIDAIARRLFGSRASVMAMLAYTASPIALRWSLQVMTDSLFTLLWTGSLAALVIAAQSIWPKLFDQGDSKSEPDDKLGFKWLLLASLAGALAALTRYQGVLLIPILGAVAWRWQATALKTAPRPPRSPWLTLLPWLLVPVWLLHQGPAPLVRQFTQIGERTSHGLLLETASNYWLYFEQFLQASPYFVTYGLFGFLLYGLFRIQYSTTRIRVSAWAALYLTLAILILQSIFQAYQERYFLPLIPLVCIGAGHGLAVWERHCKDHPVRFWALAGPALAYAIIFSSLVAYYQGSPYLDMKQAGKLLATLPEAGTIYSTERYNSDIGAAKLTFWSGGREIKPFGTVMPQPGDTIVLSSFYGANSTGGRGGWKDYQRLKEDVSKRYPYPMKEMGRFAYVSLPLLPDIMEETLWHTNPFAFLFRYQLQKFETVVYQVMGGAEEPSAVGAPEAPAPVAVPPDPAK